MDLKLELRNINYKVGDKTILKNINLIFENGIYAILGLNGSGKSSLLNIIASIRTPTGGKIIYNNNDSNKSCLKSDLGYLDQNVTLIQDLSVIQNLYYFGLLKGCASSYVKKRISLFLSEFHLDSVKNIKIRNLSGGLRQKVGIAITLINSPKIIILDEPVNNLDQVERQYFYEMIFKLSKSSIVIISTHLIDEIQAFSEKIVIIKDGNVAFSGSNNDAFRKMKENQISDVSSASLLNFYS